MCNLNIEGYILYQGMGKINTEGYILYLGMYIFIIEG
jgi:hypothetical protein